MAVDAGTAFVLQFSSIGAVKATARATEVGRAVDGVTKSVSRVRTTFSQVAGVSSQLQRMTGLNLGLAGAVGAISGRVVGAAGGVGPGGFQSRLAARMAQVTESITGFAGMIGVGLVMEHRRNQYAAHMQHTAQSAARSANVAASHANRLGRGVRALGRMAQGVTRGPVGHLVGTIAGFIGVGIGSQFAGQAVGHTVEGMMGAHQGTRLQEARRDAMMTQLAMGQAPALMAHSRLMQVEQFAQTTDMMRGSQGMMGRFNVLGRMVGGDLARRGLMESPVERRLRDLTQRVVRMEQARRRETADLLHVMRRANRL